LHTLEPECPEPYPVTSEERTVSILHRNRPPVKPTKPLRLVRRYFGEGILDEPAEPTWAPAVRRLMTEMGYTFQACSAAVLWVGTQGTADGCPDVDAFDTPLINGLVRKGVQSTLEAEADFQTDGAAVEGHPSTWPARCDAFRFVPSAEDRSSFAEMMDAEARAEASARFDRKALESRSVDNLSRGLIPPDLAGMIAITRTGGHPA
jgi:hypothetical protein